MNATSVNAPYRGRFAPSPTGPLHFGSLFTAVASWLAARRVGGEWVIRIEDVDRLREVQGAAHAQLNTLKRFGLESDVPIVYQSQRNDLYQSVLDDLQAHRHAFVCHCTRTMLSEQDGIHHRCITDHQRSDPCIRLRIPADTATLSFVDQIQGHYQQSLYQEVGDFVLRRSDGYWAYQLAVVVDDAEQQITHIVRGQDLLDSTPRQLYLQSILGYSTPTYAHVPVILDALGKKLSKSTAALSVEHEDSRAVLAQVWTLLGQSAALLPRKDSAEAMLEAMAGQFDISKIPRKLSQM